MGVITTGSLFTSSKLTGTGGNHINLGLRSWASSGSYFLSSMYASVPGVYEDVCYLLLSAFPVGSAWRYCRMACPIRIPTSHSRMFCAGSSW